VSVWYDKYSVLGLAWLMENPLPLGSYVLFLQNFFMAAHFSWGSLFLAQTWSLAVEEQFYLLSPLLIIFARPRMLPYFLVILIAAAPILRFLIFLAAPDANLAS